MNPATIRQAVERVTAHLASNPHEAGGDDPPAVSLLESGLRCRAVAPSGHEVVTDMSPALGGGGSAPSPGWLMRAALGSCIATMIAIRAAERDIALSTLEVTVVTRSDARGMFGLDDAVPAGPLNARARVRIGAHGVSGDELAELVRWAERHAPVGGALRREVPLTIDIVAA